MRWDYLDMKECSAVDTEVDTQSPAGLPGLIPQLYLVKRVQVDLGRGKADVEVASSLEGFLSLVEEV